MRIFKSYGKFIKTKYKNFDIFKPCNLNIDSDANININGYFNFNLPCILDKKII